MALKAREQVPRYSSNTYLLMVFVPGTTAFAACFPEASTLLEYSDVASIILFVA